MSAASTITTESHAKALDQQDPLRSVRERFHLPHRGGEPLVYLAGNSLGCQPREARRLVERELEDWSELAVLGHHHGRDPWLPYHEWFREPLARLVGGLPHEVVAMNSLTVNLHLLMVSFYRPTLERHRIVIEDSAFPSDSYAVASQIRFHGLDPATSLVRLRPREGQDLLRTEDIVAFFEREGASVALVMLGGVNYLTGQRMEIGPITEAAQRAGCVVGWDLAHAAGNVPVGLHDAGADFAAWCSYKYLNGGPGAIAGAWVHEKHHGADLPRFSGWWSNREASRFRMEADLDPSPDVDAWQLSNPPILAMTPLKASLRIYDDVGLAAIREKSLRLTGFMEALLRERLGERVSIVTPRDAEHRGAQLSLVVGEASRDMRQRLEEAGVVLDFREPNILRAAPAPLYVSYHDVWRFVEIISGLTR